jgi:hypothetical protein
MESATNGYVDFGTIHFCFEDQQLHVLSILPSSEWKKVSSPSRVVYFTEKPLLTTKLASPNGIRPVCVTRRPQNFNGQMTPRRSKKIYETQKLTLNLQARKVRPEGLQGDLGHHDVRRPIKVDELDTSGSPSTADTQTSV